MPLDIGIGDGTSLAPLRDQPSFSLDDDGYYWYLHPLLEELAASTGQYIDLYGDASFSGQQLGAVKKMLAKAKRLVASQPACWEVCIGQQLIPRQKNSRSRPRLKPVMATVEKAHFLDLLSRWNAVIARAKELGHPLVCFGD